MADHLEASVTLPSDPASVSAARAYVVGTLAEWGLPADTEVSDTVRLIISELATRRLPAAVQQDNGRGLVIIRWLTAECGGRLRIRPTREGGKTISIELPWVLPVQPVTTALRQEP
jgi:hypothetical protein